MSSTNNTIMTFTKYEFANETEWATYKAQIQETTSIDGTEAKSYVGCAVVELGNICFATDEEGNCTDLSTKWAIDILWYEEPKPDFTAFEVWPEPMGIHTFSGDDSLYLKGYCEKFPDSPYCKLPELVTQAENN
jgi:hypothetical protein